MKKCDSFLIFAQNLDCGSTLKPPQRVPSIYVLKQNKKPEDQWPCKRSPDYFPGITTTVKQEKGAKSIFRCSRAANSVIPYQI